MSEDNDRRRGYAGFACVVAVLCTLFGGFYFLSCPDKAKTCNLAYVGAGFFALGALVICVSFCLAVRQRQVGFLQLFLLVCCVISQF